MSQSSTPSPDVDDQGFAGGPLWSPATARASVPPPRWAWPSQVRPSWSWGRRAEAVKKTAAGHENTRWVAADVTSPADVDRDCPVP